MADHDLEKLDRDLARALLAVRGDLEQNKMRLDHLLQKVGRMESSVGVICAILILWAIVSVLRFWFS